MRMLACGCWCLLRAVCGCLLILALFTEVSSAFLLSSFFWGGMIVRKSKLENKTFSFFSFVLLMADHITLYQSTQEWC